MILGLCSGSPHTKYHTMWHPSCFTEMALRNQLEAGLKSALQAECAHEEPCKITLLKE
jgi:hypothetical protein